jgi:hypothetical protein
MSVVLKSFINIKKTIMDFKLIESKTVEELNQKLDTILLKLNDNTPKKESEWMDLSEVCLALKVSKRSIFNYINQGILSFSHLGGKKKLFFKRDDINKIIADHYKKSFR